MPRAIGMFGHSLNPDYFINPPGLHVPAARRLLGALGRARGARRRLRRRPGQRVHAGARAVAPCSARRRSGFLVWAGRRLFDLRVGLVAGALLAVAFLPVHYSHLALNDVPALAPLCLSLVGVAGVYRRGRLADYALAGRGARRRLRDQVHGRDRAAVAARGGARVAGRQDRAARAARSPAALALVGLPRRQPVRAARLPARSATAWPSSRRRRATAAASSAWSATAATSTTSPRSPGGWAGCPRSPPRPARSGCRCGTAGWRSCSSRAARVPALHGRPGPLLRALAAADLPAALPARRVGGGRDRRRGCAPGRALAGGGWSAALLCVQGLVFSIHNDVVLARDDTRELARAWMVENIPEGDRVVIEPIAPDEWAMDTGRPSAATGTGNRWNKWPTSRFRRRGWSSSRTSSARCAPSLLDRYERAGYCHVVTGSTQYGRALTEPRRGAAGDRATTTSSRDRADVVYRVSPRGEEPVRRFSFDFSFNSYPLDYERPGPGDRHLPAARLRIVDSSVNILLSQRAHAAADRRRPSRPRDRAGRGRARAHDARTRSSAPSWSRTARSSARASTPRYGEPHAEREALAACSGRSARGDALRLARAVLPPRADAAVHRRDPRGRDRARGRRLRRPDREGRRPRPRDPARRGRRGRGRRRRAGGRARGCSTSRSASTPAPAGRTCSSSRR